MNGTIVKRLSAAALAALAATSLSAATYCVIDLSAGADATSYPVSYLDAVPEGGWADEYKTTKLVLRRCPAGEDPLRRYTLTKDFYAGVFEVTEKQWELVMGTNPSGRKIGDTCPVECVTYNDIRGTQTSFIGKLRANTGIEALDLPTEAQWEYACRAGTTTKYCTGDTEADLALVGWYGKTQMGRSIQSEKKCRTLGDSTTCMEMSGSGAWIGQEAFFGG